MEYTIVNINSIHFEFESGNILKSKETERGEKGHAIRRE